jgi:glycosyltransferase involved in cell wall biosynthesis
MDQLRGCTNMFLEKRSAIHQFTTGFFHGDAMGNQAAYVRELLRNWGYRSQVYAQYRDPRLRDPGEDYRRYRGGPDDVILFHYSIGSPVTDFVRHLPGKVIPYYHNVTPARYLRGYNEPLADLLEQGRRELATFRDAPLAIAVSEYNRLEMLESGFRHVEVVPCFVDLESLRASGMSPAGQAIVDRYDDGAVNLLFVGRVVPNKRQDDLIRAFSAYYHLVNANSRLLLVGSDANAPGYRLELEALAEALDLGEHVQLAGAVGPGEGFGGYYRAADLFLCLSEHEGFGIPLLEAMAFDLPVIAYRAAGIPYTLGGAGVLVDAKRYDWIAELIDMLVQDQALRRTVVEGQRRRLAELAPDRVADKLRACIQTVQAL